MSSRYNSGSAITGGDHETTTLKQRCAGLVPVERLDTPDDAPARVRGTRQHAANFNAFTVATADRQWFHLPGAAPPRASGLLLPLSTQLIPGYSAVTAAKSHRWNRAKAIVDKNLGRTLAGDLAMREFEVVTISGRST